MKKKLYFKKLAAGMLAAAVAASMTLSGTAQEEKGAEVRSVNLNISGDIAGIGDPTSTGTGSTMWSGNYVYFGNYNGNSIQWRVLDAKTSGIFGEKDTMLLLSCSILKTMAFRAEYWADDSSEWLPSDIRTWLNDEMFQGFEKGEQAAVALSTKAALADDETELNDRVFAPLRDDRLFLLDAAEVKPAYGYDTSRSRGIGGTWWTRSAVASMNNHQGAFCPIGNSIARGGYETYIGVVPALNLDLSKVAFVTKGIAKKASEFTLTEDGGGIGVWNLTLSYGTGFRAGWASDGSAATGEEVAVEVTKLASGNPHSYTQISAMLVDEQGTVVAYGKISDEIRTGSFTVALPQEISQGRYILKVFEEEIQEDYPHLQTDYASNMANLPLTVKESGQIETETPEPETKEPESETSEPETKEPESETSEPETKEPESETSEPETKEPESETSEPETKEPESETSEPETKEPESETSEPETKEPESETSEPETKEPENETSEPETKEPESETSEPETKKPQSETPVPETKQPESMTLEPETKGVEKEPAVKRPSRPKIIKTNRVARALRIKWKKPAGKINGYQIQLSVNKKFKGAGVRTVNIKRGKTTQRRISGLKAGKRYYVRIRACRTVENKKYYSLWSVKKKI